MDLQHLLDWLIDLIGWAQIVFQRLMQCSSGPISRHVSLCLFYNYLCYTDIEIFSLCKFSGNETLCITNVWFANILKCIKFSHSYLPCIDYFLVLVNKSFNCVENWCSLNMTMQCNVTRWYRYLHRKGR